MKSAVAVGTFFMKSPVYMNVYLAGEVVMFPGSHHVGRALVQVVRTVLS